jgi:hypothetical protein
VQRFGVAAWNRERQDEPAPGAWIWGPSRARGFSDRLAGRLVQFLATQGPAADPPGGAIALPLAAASAFNERSRSGTASASDWGSTGLLQTPSARMPRTGTLTVHIGHVWPYTHGNVFVQPLDWLEAGFRYTNIANRLYGPQDLSGNQDYKDKSFDAKFRLWSESALLPEVALGMRDLAGTGLFAGEYVVGSKRFGALDLSLGLGWGYVGGRGNLRNPLSVLSSKYEKRDTDSGQGGDFKPQSYFRGPAAFFGGVQYQTPWERLALKLELDGNNYQHEPLDNNQRQATPLNFGLAWRASRGVDLSLGVERGSRLMLGLALHDRLDEAVTPKLSDPPRVPVSLHPSRPPAEPDWVSTSREIERQTGWRVGRIEQAGRELRVTVVDAQAGYWGERVDRAAAVLNRDAPPQVERFTLVYRQAGMLLAEHAIERAAWVAEQTRPMPPHERQAPVIARAPQQAPGAAPLFEQARPRFEHGLGFDLQYILGGPDAFVLYQVSAAERMRLWIRDDTWMRGTLRLGLVDNYDRFEYTAPSDLPRVRTFQREYATASRFTMPLLQLTHAGKLSDNNYYSAYGGYLEEMFGGAGTEWLYRPFGGRSAFGVDLNYVRQREFEQDFQFRGYRVATGHATAYLDTGWNDVLATVSAGRYLAGDVGATLQLSRVFRNGMALSAYATKTSAGDKYGEGSFDKGVYLAIPFDAILTRSNPSTGYVVWKPLTRDGGAKLARADPLYSVTDVRNQRTLWLKPAAKPDDESIPADRREAWPAEPW